MGRRAIARRIATVVQHAHTQPELTVREAASRIPHPYRRAWSPAWAADARAVTEALERAALTDRAAQSWHTLSGGAHQRAQIARVLAQKPRELLLVLHTGRTVAEGTRRRSSHPRSSRTSTGSMPRSVMGRGIR